MLELIALAFGIVSVWLSVRQNIWSWPTAIVNVSLYFVIFYQEKLYADMGLQVFYAAISCYGWYHWLYGGAEHAALKVSRTPRGVWPVLLLLWAGAFSGLGWLLQRHTDAAVPFVDAGLTAGSLMAQWMMTRKYVENWAVWVVLDVCYVALFLVRELYLTAFLYGVFLVLAARGYRDWSRSHAALQAAPG